MAFDELANREPNDTELYSSKLTRDTKQCEKSADDWHHAFRGLHPLSQNEFALFVTELESRGEVGMKKLVLIADDNELNRMLFSDILQAMGYDTIVAENGARAIEMARAAKPKLILMDVRMPEMDGITAVKILKKDPDTQTIPVIAITAQALSGDQENMLKAGFDGVLSKPAGLKEIRTMVAHHLDHGAQRGSPG
jgi:two-component system, cell cycle response regulator DivK